MDRKFRLALAVLLTVGAGLAGFQHGRGQVALRPLPRPPGRIAFVRDGQLWLWEGDQERQVARGDKVSQPRFSADGRYLSYQQCRQSWVMGLEGGGPWPLPPDAADPVWAPTENRLAFTTSTGVFIVQVTPAGIRPPALVAAGSADPAWSPDGQRLAVIRRSEDDRSVMVAPAAGEPVRPLVTALPQVKIECGRLVRGPLTWSADGGWVTFYSSGRSASLGMDCNDLWVVPAGGGSPIRLGAGTANPDWVEWSPSGAVLAYVDGTGREAWDNKVVRRLPMPPRPPFRSLTPPGQADRDPAWSADGRTLALTRSLSKGPERMDQPAPGQAIWVVDMRTGRQQPVTGSEAGTSPRWGPDGGLIWFTAEVSGGHRSGTLWFSPASGQSPVAVIRPLDQAHSYYGQWYWWEVYDWWWPR